MGSTYPTNRPGGEWPPLDPKSPRSELSLSAPLTRTLLPSPDPATVAPAQPGCRPGCRPACRWRAGPPTGERKAQSPASHPSSLVIFPSPLVASVLLCDTYWSKPSCSNSPAQELLPADPAVPVLRARQRSLAECSSCLARQPQHQYPLSSPRDLEVATHDIGHCPHLRSSYVRDMTCRLREREFD